MAKRGGYPGGMIPGNMNNLMKQAQRMQAKMQEQQAELENKEYTANAGGGAVSVTMNGKHEITNLTLAQEVVDPDDVEMLQDLIIAALNEVNKQIADANDASMSSLAGGMGGLGGLF